MDVFEAVDSRIACRRFLDKPVDLNIVRKLIESAARAASNGNLQPWNVYALAGAPLKEIKRQATEAIENKDWRTFETEYPALPAKLEEPYLDRSFRFGAQLCGALGTSREDRVGRLEQIKRNYQFFNAPVGLFITIHRGLGPGQWADLGGYVQGSMSTRLNDPSNGHKIVIQQRLHEADLTGVLLTTDGYELLCLPAEFEPDRRCQTSIGWIDPRTNAGELLWPQKVGRAVLEDLKTTLGSYRYAGQYQQRPAPAGGGCLRDISGSIGSHVESTCRLFP
jgi:nitroreductase